MKKITDYISRYGLLASGMKVLCAVSGGADSMCLLHYMFTRQKELGITVAAAHYEHGIRGEESLRDCAFVEAYCKDHGIEFFSEHGDVPGYAASHSLSPETAARELRYDFLSRAAKAAGADRIATAHNKNDNAETLLLHLVRGTGATGLCGIPPVRGNIIRPMLGVSREEILAFNAANGVPFVEDSTNAEDDCTRNLLRHHVMPVLQEINPAFADAALRTTALLREDEDHLWRETQDLINACVKEGSLPCDVLLRQDRALQTRMIRHMLPAPVDAEHVDAILALTEKPGLCACDVPGGRVRKEQGRLYFSEVCAAEIGEWQLPQEGEIFIPALGLKVRSEITVFDGEVHDLFNTFLLNCGEIYGRLLFTAPQTGDGLRILGRGCSKSLKKLFTEKKMTQKQRQETLVLRDGRGVLAVRGLAMAERSKPIPGAKALRITFESIENIKEN